MRERERKLGSRRSGCAALFVMLFCHYNFVMGLMQDWLDANKFDITMSNQSLISWMYYRSNKDYRRICENQCRNFCINF